MRQVFFALALGVTAFLATASDSQANGGCPGGPYCQQNGPRLRFFGQTPVPAFQAAPWYLYYPYNGHFMTPAPLMGAGSYPGAAYGGGMVNPYFPAPNGYYGVPAGPTAMPKQMPGAPTTATQPPALMPTR